MPPEPVDVREMWLMMQDYLPQGVNTSVSRELVSCSSYDGEYAFNLSWNGTEEEYMFLGMFGTYVYNISFKTFNDFVTHPDRYELTESLKLHEYL